ncbi:hypothetical protein F0L67_28520 [Escherichia coli]|nr:hypothetical protein F0L67_28520 [Escherichia coli]
MSDTLPGTTLPDDNHDRPWWGLPCTAMCDLRTTMNEMEQRYSFNADTLPERLVRQTLFRANRLLMEAYTEILELDACFKD